jgi:hypothetical protein
MEDEMEKIIEFDEECQSCGGTGVFVGMAEMDGVAVVCHNCDGTGSHHFSHKYREFEARKNRTDIKIVLQTNPGIMTGGGFHYGGKPYMEWLSNPSFDKGTEMRNFTCPAWWFQSTDYSKKPNWPECIGCGSFSTCKSFAQKEKCWEKHDREFS